MTDRPILCAFDASEPSVLAAEAAAWLARELGAPLELVYALDHDELPALPPRKPAPGPEERQAFDDLQEERAKARARAALDAMLFALRAGDASGTLLIGSPADTLRRRAAERDAALLVSGTAARRGLGHVLYGSVSGQLAAGAPCPVIAVPPGAALNEPGPVLVGDDRSAHASRAVGHAERLAERLGRELMPIHVDAGDPVEELARAAHARRACLAAVGTRGRGPLRAELLGSVSAGLVRAAGRPVMLVSQAAR